MSQLRLEHININELPPKWAKQLPRAQTVTVTIVVESLEYRPAMSKSVVIEPPSSDKVDNDNVPEDRDAYLHYLRSQGINLERLRESIEEYKAGKAEILDWDEFEKK